MSTEVQSEPAANPDLPAVPTFWNKFGFWMPHLVMVAYAGVIGRAFFIQLSDSEMPCPLCMLQRAAMILVGIAALWMIGLAKKGVLSVSAYARCYGLMMIGALVGAIISARQIELHILPDDEGYGAPVFGLHLYTWAFITFSVVLLYVAIMLTITRSTLPAVPTGDASVWISRIAIGIFIFIVAANILSIFLQEGFGLYLDDDPTRYDLFYQLGLK